MKRVLLLIALLCLSARVSATAVIVFRTPARIVFAADSLVQTTAEWIDGRTERSARLGCKIRRAGAFWYVLGGATSVGERNDIHTAVTSALVSARSVRDGVIAIRADIDRRFRRDQLDLALRDMRLLSVTVAGIDNGILTVGFYQLEGKHGTVNVGGAVCPGPVNAFCQGGDRVYFIGTATTNGRALALLKAPRPAWVEAGTATAAKRLVAMEMQAAPSLIGKPVDILELSPFGRARWIDRDPQSRCQEIP